MNHSHFGLVDLHFHAETVGFRRHSLGNDFIHITVQLLHRLQEALGKPFFALQGNDAPVGFVHTDEQVLLLHRVLLTGGFLGQTRYAVIGSDLTAHINRLGQQHGSTGHIAGVGGESIQNVLPGSIHHR